MSPAVPVSPGISNTTRKVVIPQRRVLGHLQGGPHVYIFALTRPVQLTALLGPGGAHITGGYGKWEEVAIPRGIPFTQWNGRSLWTMELDLLLDGWSAHRSVEHDIYQIECMALRPGHKISGHYIPTPPPIRFVGPVPHPEFTWVITGIDYGDALRDDRSGVRLRQGLVLHLLEYVDERVVSALPPPPPPPRKYKVKKGDNLKKVATRYLGKSSRWPDIVKLNKKSLRGWRIPKKMIGKTILIPPR